jgi:hypothetical protein
VRQWVLLLLAASFGSRQVCKRRQPGLATGMRLLPVALTAVDGQTRLRLGTLLNQPVSLTAMGAATNGLESPK